ncbi:DUF4340 domain-containing protein [Ruminococcus sp.]|uniref:DUF4340 domain-containing protein n=1 Tax=Ruminococcus sp. TaxID=41978 RepID=UPI0025FB83C8|nr:DUF4340 domain-containing protein [Ruminococcus sp.]MBQ8965590.1 DUF4340 domain-containing protein [Ruminococcus sp.]
MNGKVQGIVICGVIAASLAGVLVFLNTTGDGSKKDSSSSSSADTASSAGEMEHYVVLDKDAAEISAVTAVNEAGGFTLDRPASGKSSWTIEEITSINQNKVMIEDVIDKCGLLEASKIAEEGASDLGKYGLDEPAASFTVSYLDGSSKTVLVGDTAPDSKYTYIKLEDDDTVYMMLGSRIKYFLESALDFANLSLIAQPVNDSDWPEYGKETITRSDWDYNVVFENDPKDIEGMLSSQVISEPIFAYLNITGSSAVTHGMWGLTAHSCAAAAPDEAQLAEFGLDEPRCVVSLKGDEYDYKLSVGGEAYDPDVAETDTPVLLGYYCTLEGVTGCNAVYVIPEQNLPWVTFKIEDVISNLMTTNYLVDLAEMSIDMGGTKTVYDIETNGGSSDTDENGKAADVQAVTAGGKDIDVYEFKSLYQFIMSCPTNEICFEDPSGEPEVTITETRKDGGEDVIELYKDTARRYVVKLNGKTSFRIQSTWVDSLGTNIESVNNGGKVNDNY